MPESKKEDALAPISADEKEKVVIVSEDTSQKQSKPRGELLRRVLGFFLRLVLFLAFLAALAAGAYYGLPILYEKYVRPVEMNSSQLTELTEQQSQHEAQIADLETGLATLEAAQCARRRSPRHP